MRRHVPAALALALFAGSLSSAIAFDDHLFVVTSDLQISGNGAALELTAPFAATINLEPVSPDPVVRHHGGLHAVVNRLGADNIQIIDPGTFSTIQEFSVGAGSNPQDIVFINPAIAYVTRYETRWLHKVNPGTGALIATIDLGSLADADGIPEMSMMALDGDHLLIQIQRWNRVTWQLVPPSYLAVLDVITDQLVDVDPDIPGSQAIVLSGRNPSGKMHLDPVNRRLYVATTGEYGQNDGGIEAIDLDTLTSLGFITTEAQLGGDVGAFALVSPTRAYAIVSDDFFFSSELASFSPATGARLGTHYTTPAFAPAIVHDPVTSRLFLADTNPTASGIHVFNAATGQRLTSTPVFVGLLPMDMVVARDAPLGSPVTPPLMEEHVRAAPNPTRGGTTIHLTGPVTGPVMLRVFTPTGRWVREIAIGGAGGDGGHIVWDGRDAAGRPVPAGVYLYRVIGTGVDASGRLVVDR